jgi:hypothetical protein
MNAGRNLRVYQLFNTLSNVHQPKFMKHLFSTKILIAMAVAIAAAASVVVMAQDQPMPPPAAPADALPPDIQPGTPLADVVKLLQDGVDVSTIKNFIANTTGTFNLDADKIIYLKDEGLPSDVVNSMMDHDKSIYAATQTPPPAAPVVTATADTTDTAPPAAPVTVNYFTDTLSPYGSWVDVEGYGRCWRPTAVIYDSGWRPYCDRGHWVYTDSGWYWDSDYSWGITFHYGRWFRHDRFGWCWMPDTTWAPSWVAWRSADDYCGWAPLPPFAVFTPGVGFFYRGRACSADFDFGLGADFFVFVAPEHFCDRRPRQYCAPPERVREVFHRTTIVNNWDSHDHGRDHVIVNGGIDVNRLAAASHHPIEPVHVGELPNAGRQGWRGETTVHPRSGVIHGQPGNNGNNYNPGHGSSSAGYDSHPANPAPTHNSGPYAHQNTDPNPVHNNGQYAPQNTGGNIQRDHSLNNGSHIQNNPPVNHYQPTVPTQPSQPQRIERTIPENNYHQPSQPSAPVQNQQHWQQPTEPRNIAPPQVHQESQPRSYSAPPETHYSPPPQVHEQSVQHSSPPPSQPSSGSHGPDRGSGSDQKSDDKHNH